MNKTILRRNSALIATSTSPSWKTGEESGFFLPLVQSSQVSLSLDRQSSKQIGSQMYAIDDTVRSPDVSFNMEYLFSPYMVNEYLMGIYDSKSTPASITTQQSNRSQNFYVLMDDKQGNEILDYFSKQPEKSGFSGLSCMSIGNCYLSNYSLDFSIGSIPTAKMSFVGSNIKMDNLTGNVISIPSINLQSGNTSGAGFLDFGKFKNSFSGFLDEANIDAPSIYKLPVVSPADVNVTLQNLQFGGCEIASNALVQSLGISIPFDREASYGLGSNYVYNRALKMPTRASIDISVIVENFNTGNLSQLTSEESLYDFKIEFSDRQETAKAAFNFKSARLNSSSYSLSNGYMEFTASYSVEITDLGGLQINSFTKWSELNEEWQNIVFAWSNVQN
jgi:hypothetical protein